MEIKICGITNLKDALHACKSGADAIGFIFYRKSPRYIEPRTARDIIKDLPRHISRVGVFVNHDPGEVKDIFSLCRLSMIQLHGDESPEYCFQFPSSTLIKAVSLKSETSLDILEHYPVKAILMDSRINGQYGGTGKECDWNLAIRVKAVHPLILAGGLTDDNIREAIRVVSPHAVDLNSGVEHSPGKKDPVKVKNIIQMIREIKINGLKEVNTSDSRIFTGTL
jgi:phosphoribosylanthranilate isomerase